MNRIVWHRHHLVPKHAGGTDDPNNLVRVNVAMHAFLHKCRYETYGCEEDFIAWKALSGHTSYSEARELAMELGRKKAWANSQWKKNPNEASLAGKKNAKKHFNSERQAKYASLGGYARVKSEDFPEQCRNGGIRCGELGLTGFQTGKAGKAGGKAAIEKGKNYILNASKKTLSNMGRKGGAANASSPKCAMKRRGICPHCGKESNIPNLSQHHFDRCRHKNGGFS